MPASAASASTVIVAGGGIGGLAAALALARRGFAVKVLEQAAEIGEIGAGVQLAPNAFAAFDALGVGEQARGRAVYNERMVMMDATDATTVAEIPLGDAFRARFGNPYAVIHRADVHQSLLDGVQAHGGIELLTSTRVLHAEQSADGVTVFDANGRGHRGAALIGCDGVKSAVRAQLVGDPVRVSGHVVYRAVVDAAEFPKDLAWNAAAVWAGPDCHLVHYPLRGGEQYNVVVTFHSRETETWGVSEGSQEEVLSYFGGVCDQAAPAAAPAEELEALGHRRPGADRALERRPDHPARRRRPSDAAVPGAGRLHGARGRGDARRGAATPSGGDLSARVRASTSARASPAPPASCCMTREMGRLYHAKGVERLVRNELWKGRTPERFYDALEWLYGWRVERCLAA